MDARPTVEQLLAQCRVAYTDGKSDEALPLARVALAQARERGERALIHRTLNACGILCVDTFDVVGGLEFHLESLRLAQREADAGETSRVWNNIGIALAFAGSPAMAVRAYAHSMRALEDTNATLPHRYSPFSNSANSHFHMSAYDEGLRLARRGLQELRPEHVNAEIFGAVLLRRNVVNLLVATGRVDEAVEHVEELSRLDAQANSPRTSIAAAIARATYELAIGRSDIALTRLEQALDRARATPSSLRDTLACIIRAEEVAGSPERALARLEELSQLVYRSAIEQARHNVELSSLDDSLGMPEHSRLQSQRRLQSRLARPEAPGGWDALRRLAVSAGLKLDSSGWHGIRVGTLTKALALESGEPALRALEIGLAAELHDVGALSVPDAILSRRGALADYEIEAYYRHTDAGADILREDGHPRYLVAREVAMYHHAWWDGTGYPRRVGGKSIPLPARMCAVADTYDELVCGFRGTLGMTMSRALEALQKKAGTQLDPELVDRFTSVVTQETQGHGIDPSLGPSFDAFQRLIDALQQDRGYI
ncbi:MAG TPA: HD domain-containing phosphohydrolase [Usitatibacter sp.]|jgi:putative two-component system response regulator